MNELIIERMTAESWSDVNRIYESGIASKNATFETSVPDWDTWDRAHRKDCRIIAKIKGKVIGWAAISGISDRRVYSGVAEISIYVDPDFRGKGVGDSLMNAMIKESELSGIWTLQAGVFPENVASLKLHRKYGFRTVGVRERLGRMDDRWRDVLLLERRSKTVGID
jgi:L-amino acid N-acyltransferase YncA